MSPPFSERRAELSALLDGELEASRAAELRERIARDPELAAEWEALRAVDRELRAIPPPRVSADMATRMRARLDAERRAAVGVIPRRRIRFRRAGLAVAALAAALVMALLIRSQIGGGPEPTIAPGPRTSPDPAPAIETPLPRELIAPAPTREPGLPTPPPGSDPAALPRGADGTISEKIALRGAIPKPERIAPEHVIPAPGASAVETTPADSIETATDEELGLALALEALGATPETAEDLAIIEALEFVRQLDEADLGGTGRG